LRRAYEVRFGLISVAMTYIPSFIKISLGIPKLVLGIHRHINANTDHISIKVKVKLSLCLTKHYAMKM
jgi:hypothetical protein